jgi:hypothetical protein
MDATRRALLGAAALGATGLALPGETWHFHWRSPANTSRK